MIRGPIASDPVRKHDYWYPYPFLDPNNSPEGYATVYIILIAVVIGLVASGVIWISRR
jgi:hypothetical protein